ncbi:phasin family protein [Candidatus Accumulibacter sp. ACC003]|uniref:phasin family protein n=1 Tax=Candidatus Accumulibacter sp. ACC003 TaxID=2823334 RepID=UPI0025B84002|nr:phasin family protein [Candidatus Accumulibacter sp. ACC003]
MSTTLTTLVDRASNEQLLLKARESARKLWLFGLGAYSLATRSGVQTFAMLVREGQAFRPRARRQIDEKSAELMSDASATIDRGEQLLARRIARPLDGLLPASKRDVGQISKRLLQLTSEVQKLTAVPARAKPAKPAERLEQPSLDALRN